MRTKATLLWAFILLLTLIGLALASTVAHGFWAGVLVAISANQLAIILLRRVEDST